MTAIRTHQNGNSINDTPFVGIIFNGWYIAIGFTKSKAFKTELWARKWMRKMWYDC